MLTLTALFCFALLGVDGIFVDPVKLDLDSYEIFQKPSQMDFDSNGNLYICDKGTGQITRISTTFEIEYSFGGKGDGPGEFTLLYDIAIDRTNNLIWALDTRGYSMACFDLKGKLLKHFDLDHTPYSISLKQNGSIVGGGPEQQNFWFFQDSLKEVEFFGRNLRSSMDKPKIKDLTGRFMAITLDREDNIYAAYLYEPTIACYDTNGKLKWSKERMWFDRSREPVKPKLLGGMSLNPNTTIYHLDIGLFQNKLLVSTDQGESAIIIFDSETGAYLGHEKIPFRARGIAVWKENVFLLDGSENSLYVYRAKGPIHLSKSKTYESRHLVSPNAQVRESKDKNGCCSNGGCSCDNPTKASTSCQSSCCNE